MMKLDELVHWYNTLTPATIAELHGLYREDARFRDPFNDVRGHEAIAAIFEHMFATTQSPQFRIGETHRDLDTAWVSWVFDCELRGKSLSIEGTTRLDFASDGRVIEHRDYWDTADLFVEFPLLGAALRHLRKRMATPGRGDKETNNA